MNLGGKKSFWFVIIFFAAWNAVLRPSPSIPITPYYLLMPLVCLFVGMRAHWAKRLLIWYALFAIYGFIVGMLFGVPISMQAAQLLKYAQLLTFFLLLTWLYTTVPDASIRLRNLIRLLTILVFVIAVTQALTGLEFPTVVNEESDLWLNTFFYTPNDLALFLCGVFCLVLCANTHFLKKTLFFFAFIALNLRNDAKAAILASFVMIGMYFFVWFCRCLRIRPFFGLLALILLIYFAIANVGDGKIEIGDSEFNFLELFLDPLERIVNLEPYNLGGSIFDRTDALIYSLKAFESMNWFGLGPAGSVYNMSLPVYELTSAKSLHNAIAEFFVEFGPTSLILFYILLRPFMRAILCKRPTSKQVCLMCFVAASPLLSVSQSSGYISNYAFWLSAFLVWYPVALGSISERHKSPLNLPLAQSPSHNTALKL